MVIDSLHELLVCKYQLSFFFVCMETVLIAGGTGLIGKHLSKALVQKGYKIIVLTRQGNSASDVEYAIWDPQTRTIDRAAIERADHIINLAGANVADGRWTEKKKREIVSSRVMTGETIVRALQEIPNGVRTVINSSAIGWYGPDKINSKPFVESDPHYTDFLGTTCRQWEDSIKPVEQLEKRLVILRTGIVLSKVGGAYAEFRKPVSFHVAPILGSGKQVISWIAIEDIVGLYVAAIENSRMSGIYNAVAPNPVSNREMMKTIVSVTGTRCVFVKVPAFALKIALGEMSIEVLKSTTVSAEKVLSAGYRFAYPGINSAIRHLENK